MTEVRKPEKFILNAENYEWKPEKTFFQSYPTTLLKCKHCDHVFADEEKHYVAFNDNLILVCETCSKTLETMPDFNPEGSCEPSPQKWSWMRRLALFRDHYRCCICGDYNREAKGNVEVHHIIPLKVGGTNHLTNLITLCLKHHQETFKNEHAGLKITDLLIKHGIQKTIVEEKVGV